MEPRISAETTEKVVVHMADGSQLTGSMHVPRHSRLLDILNHQADARPFFALTDVEWTAGGEVRKHEFVCVHRAHVTSVHPAG